MLVYAEDGVITAEIFPDSQYCKDMIKEDISAALIELIGKINKSVTSAKMIRRIRLRNVEFEKTTSKKIRCNQSIKGELI